MSSILKNNIKFLIGSVILSALIDAFIPKGVDSGVLTITLLCVLITIQVLVNIIASIVSLFKRNGHFKYYLLSILLVLLIGFPLCWGGAFLVSLIHSFIDFILRGH